MARYRLGRWLRPRVALFVLLTAWHWAHQRRTQGAVTLVPCADNDESRNVSDSVPDIAVPQERAQARTAVEGAMLAQLTVGNRCHDWPSDVP